MLFILTSTYLVVAETRMEFELHSPSRRGELSNGWEESVYAINHTWSPLLENPLVKLMEQAITVFSGLFFFFFFAIS